VSGELRSDGPLVRAGDWRDRGVAGKRHGSELGRRLSEHRRWSQNGHKTGTLRADWEGKTRLAKTFEMWWPGTELTADASLFSTTLSPSFFNNLTLLRYFSARSDSVPDHGDNEGLESELPLAQSAFSPLLSAAWLKIAASISL
jgi:hypothetical protein